MDDQPGKQKENGALALVLYPDAALRAVCEDVREFGPDLAADVKALQALLHTQSNAVSLSANQGGLTSRILVFKKDTLDGVTEMINPVIATATGKQFVQDGSVSMPGFSSKSKRKNTITVRYQTLKGGVKSVTLMGFPSAVIQHGVDSLDGRLFTDRLPKSRQMKFRKKFGAEPGA